jgi:hypothetical protein
MISLAISETKLCRAGSSDPAISPEAWRGLATPPYNSNCMDPARTVLWTSRSTQLHASAQVQIGGCEQLPVFAPGRWRSWRPWGSGEPITNGRFRQARRAAPVTNATAAADREVRPPVRDARCEPQTIREMLAIRRSFVLLCHDKPNRIKRSGYGISAP